MDNGKCAVGTLHVTRRKASRHPAHSELENSPLSSKPGQSEDTSTPQLVETAWFELYFGGAVICFKGNEQAGLEVLSRISLPAMLGWTLTHVEHEYISKKLCMFQKRAAGFGDKVAPVIEELTELTNREFGEFVVSLLDDFFEDKKKWEGIDKVYTKVLQSLGTSHTSVESNVRSHANRLVVNISSGSGSLFKQLLVGADIDNLKHRFAKVESAMKKTKTREQLDAMSRELPKDLTPGAKPITSRLDAFLCGNQRVLLLRAPRGSGKTKILSYLAEKAYNEHSILPVYVYISPNDDGSYEGGPVVKALRDRGLDDLAISNGKARSQFILLIEGFDTCGIAHNFYVRNRLEEWRGKAVFTCRSSYLAKSARPEYYFMPSSSHDRPNPQGLCVIDFTTSSSLMEDEPQCIAQSMYIIFLITT